jgi:AcrR family transcriptional regulator
MAKEVLKSDVGVKGKGRNARRKRTTRARLLEAGHDIMAEVGVDAAKIQDITDQADVGFGTFYNYFASKDAIAGEILDCMIHDCGVRNAAATKKLAISDPAAVMPMSIRLFLREAANKSIWRWWVDRPDLLVNRVRAGHAEFAKKDMRQGLEDGFLRLQLDQIDQAWALACWIMVGGMHDIIVGDSPLKSESFVAHSIMRAWGYDLETAHRVSTMPLPRYGVPKIDWNFKLQLPADEQASVELDSRLAPGE